MAEKKTTPIVIDDKEYTFEDMTPEQQEMVNHVADLDRKIRSAQFNMTQLEGGRKFFIDILKESLGNTPENAQEVAAE
jgi:hypothetical protein